MFTASKLDVWWGYGYYTGYGGFGVCVKLQVGVTVNFLLP